MSRRSNERRDRRPETASQLPSPAADHSRGLVWRAFSIWTAGLLAVDQLTKAWFHRYECGEVICPLRNAEFMLGIAAGSTLQVMTASMVGLALFGWWCRAVSRFACIPPWSSGLVVAGILGNLIDRAFFGSVRDFLVFPGDVVVNVADLALGIGLLSATASVLQAALRGRRRGGA